MANPYFNAAYYLATYPDLVLAGLDETNVEQHYLNYGAQEGRAPNNWFDAQFYLLNNPDLIAAGLTRADALAHYAQYGINEGRSFSEKVALAPANFNAKAYADVPANKDLLTAFEITDTANLTPAQTSQLFGHYLAYGQYEGRDAGAANNPYTVALNPLINVDTAGNVTLGTVLNDTFVWADPDVSPAQLKAVDGLGGIDTLKINTLSATAANNSITVKNVEKIDVTGTGTLEVKGSGVQTVTLNNGAGALNYNGALVNGLVITGAGLVTTGFTGVSGTTDALAVSFAPTAAGTGSITTTGIEQLSVALNENVTAATISADSVNGAALSVIVSGGKAETAATITVNSLASGDLATVTVDASTGLGNQTINLGAQLANVSAVVKGGAGNDILTANAGLGKSTILEGGAGTDQLTASVGHDTLSGGAGNDTFIITIANGVAVTEGTDAASRKITAVDTITDFAAGDKLQVASLAVVDGIDASIGAVNGAGVLTFQTGFLSGKGLTEIVKALSSDTNFDTAGEAVLFNFGGNAYLFAAGATAADITDDAVIQLTGVDANLLQITAGLVDYA